MITQQTLRLSLLVVLLVGAECNIYYMAHVFRHGARYPLSDIYDGNETKQYHGHLTSVGKRELYLLGSYIRHDYIDEAKLLSHNLVPPEIEVFADASERCVESTESYTLGLFPFGSGLTLPTGLDRKYLLPPFETASSLRSEEDAEEFALGKGFTSFPIRSSEPFFPKCKNQALILAQRVEKLAVNFAEFQLEQAAFTDLMRLKFNLTIQQANIVGLAELFDVVVCDKFLMRQMPSSFTDQDFKQLTFIQNYLLVQIYSEEVSLLFSTPNLAAIINNMEHAISNSSQLKRMSAYGVHDINVIPLLTALNLTSGACLKRKFKNETISGNCAQSPPFGGNLIIELLNDSPQRVVDEFYVKVRYDGKYYNLCESDSTKCPFTQFKQRVQTRFLDFHQKCGN